MATPRSLLNSPPDITNQANQQRKHQKLREHLARERNALARWQTRLKRAFNAVEKVQKHIVRLEKQLANLRE